MPGFIIDEDLPRSLARDLTDAGFEATHVTDAGLASQSDEIVFGFAISKGLAVVTRDVGYSTLHRESSGKHSGILICRFHKAITIQAIKKATIEAIARLEIRELPGALFVIAPGRVRLRRRR